MWYLSFFTLMTEFFQITEMLTRATETQRLRDVRKWKPCRSRFWMSLPSLQQLWCIFYRRTSSWGFAVLLLVEIPSKRSLLRVHSSWTKVLVMNYWYFPPMSFRLEWVFDGCCWLASMEDGGHKDPAEAKHAPGQFDIGHVSEWVLF